MAERFKFPGADAAGNPSERGGYAPYFSPSTPPDSNAHNGKPFYYTPGEHFTFPPPGLAIEIWDDDANNTLNGYIPVRKEGDACPDSVTDTHMGCFEKVEFGVNGKYVEDPVHVEVGVYIGSHDWNPGSSRWWFPYKSFREGTARADFSYANDKFENIKQKYRCSEYNPTLPGLDWHTENDRKYPGNPDQSLHYPNPDPGATNCWTEFESPLASDKLNVTYEHVKDADGNPMTNRTRLTVQFKEDASFLDTNIPNPQRIICLTWKGMIGSKLHIPNGVETTRCWSIIFNVRPKLATCGDPDEFSTLGPDTNNCSRLSLFRTDSEDGDESELSVAVGQDFMSYVYFEDGNRDLTRNCTTCDTVEISVAADPGLPNNAALDKTKGPLDLSSAANAPSREVPLFFQGMQTEASYFQYSRKFSFKPDEGSAMKVGSSERNGLRYKVCFEATSKTTSFYQGTIEMKSREVCAYIQVVRPEPKLSAVTQMQIGLDDEPLPMVSVAMMKDVQDGIVSAEGLPFVARVRCPYKWKIHTYEQKATYPHAGLQYETEYKAGYKKDQYIPVAKEDPEHRLPKGAKLMQDPNSDHQILAWSPERGMEGKRFNFCLIITDKHTSVGSYRKCTSILVQKCEVCGLPSDTLHSISMEYKTDWLQLWGANYNISNPNHLKDYRALKLGPLYTTNKMEKISSLAMRFSMTPTTLIEVNPDLKGHSTVENGTQVCLVPVICGQS